MHTSSIVIPELVGRKYSTLSLSPDACEPDLGREPAREPSRDAVGVLGRPGRPRGFGVVGLEIGVVARDLDPVREASRDTVLFREPGGRPGPRLTAGGGSFARFRPTLRAVAWSSAARANCAAFRSSASAWALALAIKASRSFLA